MNIYEKLLNIQSKLKAPKNQRNDFGKYNYRSCEDILEAVKPICFENKVTLVLSDEIINIGQRYYIKAIATLYDIENENQSITNTAYARESEIKKGMDDSQITGTASSYARKYALNGLFNIDDTKDADTNEYHKQNDKEKAIEEIDINAKVGFGKYKDITWIELYNSNKNYFGWLIEHAKTEEGAKTYRKIFDEIEKSFIVLNDEELDINDMHQYDGNS